MSRRAQRFEVFTGAGKRREWPPEVKASIVAECYSGREGVSAVARRHGLDSSQVYVWRRDLRKQFEAEGMIVPSAEPEAPAFVPAIIAPSTMSEPVSPRRARSQRRATGTVVELEIDGVAVKIGRGADAGMIAAVIFDNATERYSWALKIEKQRGLRMAKVALARRLAAILHAMLRDGTLFEAVIR